MTKFIGVTDYFKYLYSEEDIKKAALIFDHISPAGIEMVRWITGITNSKKVDDIKKSLDKIEFLKENNIIIEPPPLFGSKKMAEEILENQLPKILLKSSILKHFTQTQNTPIGDKLTENAVRGITRRAAVRLTQNTGWDVVSLATPQNTDPSFFQNGKNTVLQVVLKNLPTPDLETPWEKIIDYRNEADSRGKFYRFKNWLNNVVKSNRTPNEIEDEIRELLYEYEEYMKLHKMKLQTSSLETIITVAADVAEGLVKFKWGKTAKSLFSIRKNQIELLEKERDAPGREIAYLIDIKSKFSR